MCEINTRETSPGHLEITCKKTGKPITVTNENGMFCEDMCDEDKCIEAKKAIEKIFDLLGIDS